VNTSTVNDVCTSVTDATACAPPQERSTPVRPDPPPVRRAKAAILRIGELLHGSREDVIAFTEAVTGVTWDACDQCDLAAVLAEYRVMIHAIEDKKARHGGHSQECAVKGANHA